MIGHKNNTVSPRLYIAVAVALLAAFGGYLYMDYQKMKERTAAYVAAPQTGDLVLIEGQGRQFVVAKVSSLEETAIVLALGKTIYPNYRAALTHVKDAGTPDYFSDEEMRMPRDRYTAENIPYVERPPN